MKQSATTESGKRFLLGLIAIVTPLCAFMPNATTVILLAPIVICAAKALDVGFVGPMIFVALISNSAGLLTLLGDPVTLLIGSSIGMTFIEYLKRISLGAVAALLVLIPLHALRLARDPGADWDLGGLCDDPLLLGQQIRPSRSPHFPLGQNARPHTR